MSARRRDPGFSVAGGIGMLRSAKVLLAFLLVPGLCLAQVERLELGKRLRKFEKAWDAQTDAARRREAVSELQKAVASFFSFRLAEAGRSLDQARFKLTEAKEVLDEKRWAESLHLQLERYLVEADVPTLAVTVAEFYATGIMPPEGAAARLTVAGSDGKPVRPPTTAGITGLPQTVKLNLKDVPPGDYQLAFEVLVTGEVFAQSSYGFSIAKQLKDRLARLEEGVNRLPRRKTEGETARFLIKLLSDLARDRVPETDYPANRLLAEAEALAAAQEPYYTAERAGQFWLALGTEPGPTIVRLQIPSGLSKEKPVPLVLALHGAGGSENLFFDGYGNGAVARLCGERGWVLAAPRLGVGGLSLAAIVDELAKRYPIDTKRVFLVGHSMGAGQALSAVSSSPEKFAAVAALGGGNALRRTENIQNIPFFIGVGSLDFALRGAQALRESLKRAEVKTVEYKEYPEIEHLVIVQVALPDVFAFFDRVAKGS